MATPKPKRKYPTVHTDPGSHKFLGEASKGFIQLNLHVTQEEFKALSRLGKAFTESGKPESNARWLLAMALCEPKAAFARYHSFVRYLQAEGLEQRGFNIMNLVADQIRQQRKAREV